MRELRFVRRVSSNCTARCFGIVRDDEDLPTTDDGIPGVGPLVADHVQIGDRRSGPVRSVEERSARYFGLVPKKYQSGERDVTGTITRTGCAWYAVALYEAANVMLTRITPVLQPEALGSRCGEAARPEACQGRPSAASWRRFCTACGSMAPRSIGASRPRHRRVTRGEFGVRGRPASAPEVPLPGRGSGEAVRSTVAAYIR